MDTASPVQCNSTIQLSAHQEESGGAGKRKQQFTCGAEYDLYRGRDVERKHDIVQQRARRKGGDLEQPLRDGHLARFEP